MSKACLPDGSLKFPPHPGPPITVRKLSEAVRVAEEALMRLRGVRTNAQLGVKVGYWHVGRESLSYAYAHKEYAVDDVSDGRCQDRRIMSVEGLREAAGRQS